MPNLSLFSILSTGVLLVSACSLLEQPTSESDEGENGAECETDADCRPEAFCSNGNCIGRPSSGGASAGGAGGTMTGGLGGTDSAGAVSGLGGTDGTGAVSGQGGTVATGGTPTTGGAAGANSTGGTPPTIVACPSSISTGVTACTNHCAGSICGLGDLGRRDCVCSGGVYRCASCQFPGAQPVTQQPAGSLPACAGGIEDNVTCNPQGDRCMLGEEVCACLAENTSVRWDCDDPPWGRPPCPAALPANGSGCGVTRYSCVYGATYCSCEASGLWACSAS